MKPETAVPGYWKIYLIRVLFKKGDDRLPENYRPICIIPIMYKFFSRILTRRIKKQIYKDQSIDQAGFRPGFSCDDHLFTLSILTEKCNEFNIPLWVATLDYKKAFDSVKQTSIWEALREQEVPLLYINLLTKLYDGQQARIQIDTHSDLFEIKRGTKQGDPVSPILFISVLEHIMRKVKEKWTKKYRGI